MICKNCGAENSDSAKFCTNCGASLVLETKTEELIYPPKEPYSPVLIIILNFLIPGLGNFICGQREKGVFWFVLALIILFVTLGILSVVVSVLCILDGYFIAQKLKNGNPVGKWEFFPKD